MDFASLKNNPLYGPLRLMVVAALGIAIHRGWIPQNIVDPDVMTLVLLSAFVTWSLWQQNHTAKKADLATNVAINSAVAAATGDPARQLSPALQAAIVTGSKMIANKVPETQVTDMLNAASDAAAKKSQ